MENQLLDFCRFYPKIYCYGAGAYGRLAQIFLKEQGYGIKGFIVLDGHKKSAMCWLEMR